MAGSGNGGRCDLDRAQYDPDADEDYECPEEPWPPQRAVGAFFHQPSTTGLA